MLILNPTRKSRASCCGNCRSGKPCCGKKPRRVPRFERRGGLWLPRLEFMRPMALVGSPREQEWPGSVVRPWLPPLAYTYDLSCLECCHGMCCGSTADVTMTITSATGTCNACLPGDSATLLNGAADSWTHTGADIACDADEITVSIGCVEATGQYEVGMSCIAGFIFGSGIATNVVCDPFSFDFCLTLADPDMVGGCCTGEVCGTVSA